MDDRPLGRLERVEPGNVWKSERSDFTPWLAAPENLSRLGDALRLDLEPMAREQPVGPFRADLLCRDAATRSPVVIEAQLGRTDHLHLGQILTYARGARRRRRGLAGGAVPRRTPRGARLAEPPRLRPLLRGRDRRVEDRRFARRAALQRGRETRATGRRPPPRRPRSARGPSAAP